MFTFLFVMTQDVIVFFCILDILAAVPESQLKDNFNFCGSTRTRPLRYQRTLNWVNPPKIG
jgi:hypothetical protein